VISATALGRAEGKPAQYRRFTPASIATNLVLGAFGVVFASPMLWLVLASFDQHAGWQVKVPELTLGNYRTVISYNYLDPIWNSLYLSLVATAVTTAVSIITGYVLSTRHIPLKRTIMLSVLLLTGIPVTVLIVPIYELFVQLNWLNSIPAVGLLMAASSLPFGIWLMKNYIDAVPVEILEAAAVDGVGTRRTVLGVILPATYSGVLVTVMVTFINAWGAFLVPLILISNPGSEPGSIALYQFLSAFVTPRIGPLAAYSLIFSLPVVVLYLFVARRLAGGFAFGGGVKG